MNRLGERQNDELNSQPTIYAQHMKAREGVPAEAEAAEELAT